MLRRTDRVGSRGVPWSRCPSVGSFPRVVALAAVAALVVTLFSAADGREPGPAAPVLRQHPNIAPFQGMGVWVDLYDDAAWADPAAAVAGMAAHGVHTLYLETSNFNRPFPFVDKQGVAAFVDAAHDDGVADRRVVPPRFRRTWGSTPRVRRPRSGSGPTPATRSTGSRWTSRTRTSPTSSVRTARLLDLSTRLRSFAGESYPLGGIIPSPRGIVVHKDYWPGFPYADLAAIYDVIMPMSYFTWHHPTGRQHAPVPHAEHPDHPARGRQRPGADPRDRRHRAGREPRRRRRRS